MTDLIQITGSEVSSLFNLGYGCRLHLWRKKRGQEPDFERNNKAIKLNDALLDYFQNEYEKASGRNLDWSGWDNEALMYSGFYAWRNGLSAPVIIKPVSREGFFRVKRNGLSEDQILELHAVILTTESTWGSYAVGSRDSGELLTFDIDRDEAICQSIADELPLFQAQVENGPAPAMLEPDDRRCQKCEYRVSCQGAALLDITESTENDESLRPLIDEYQSRQQIVKDADELVAETRAELEERLGSRTQVFCGKKRVDWKVQERMIQDAKALAAKYEELRREMLTIAKFQEWNAFIESMPAKFPPAEEFKKPSISRPLRIWG